MMKKLWMLSLAVLFAAGLAGTSYAASSIDFGGSLRLRATSVNTEDASGRGFFEQRTRLNVNAKANENMRVFISLQDSRDWGTEASTASTSTDGTATDDGIDLSQGYIEFSNLLGKNLSIKAGRQAIALGNHRLVGSFEWSNTARRFDAISLNYTPVEAVNIFAWYSKVHEHYAVDPDTDFSGVYATIKAIPHNTVALYLMDQRGGSQGVGANSTQGGTVVLGVNAPSMNQITTAVRVYGGIMGIDWNAEYAKQTGEASATVDIDADALSVEVGYTIPNTPALRIAAGYDNASGEDGDATTTAQFDNLYPTNHYKYGYYNDVSWTNMKAFTANVSAKPLPGLMVRLEYWDYKLDEEAMGANGSMTDDNGTEINARAKYKLNNNTTIEAQVAQRDAGDIAVAGGYVGTAATQVLAADKSSTLAIAFINVTF